MTLDEFLEKYPAIKERAYKDPVIKMVIDKHVNDYSEYGINETELLYKLFLNVNSVREKLDQRFKEYVNNMPYQVIKTNQKVNGSK